MIMIIVKVYSILIFVGINVFPNNAYRYLPLLQSSRSPKTLRVIGNDAPILNIFRPLGSYERLLARRVKKANQNESLALSHVSVLHLSKPLSEVNLHVAVSRLIERHPTLRSYISCDDVQLWIELPETKEIITRQVIKTIEVYNEEKKDKIWRDLFEESLNNAEFDYRGPQWRLYNIQSQATSSLVFVFNHALDDQTSLNSISSELLEHLNSPSSLEEIKPKDFPPSIESAIIKSDLVFAGKTIFWAIYQFLNSISMYSVLPKSLCNLKSNDPEKYSHFANPQSRKTFCRFFSLTREETSALRKVSSAQNISVTHSLAAAVMLTSAALIHDFDIKSLLSDKNTRIRFLLSVNLRPYGKASQVDFTGGTVACASGAVDYIIDIPHNDDLVRFPTENKPCDVPEFTSIFWSVANNSKLMANKILHEWKLVPQSVGLFDFGMKTVDVLKAVEIASRNPSNLGRGYTCGVSNMGPVLVQGNSNCNSSSSFRCISAYYGTSHANNGNLLQLSCMTIDGQLYGCLQFPSPIISDIYADTVSSMVCNILKSISL